jgi:hypothetical protein
MMRIRPDPDQQHCNMVYNMYKAKIFGTLLANGRLQFRSIFYIRTDFLFLRLDLFDLHVLISEFLEKIYIFGGAIWFINI